jgi:hypothetical protein
MALVQPRGAVQLLPPSINVSNIVLNTTISTISQANSTFPLTSKQTSRKRSWLSRVLSHVPGYNWIKDKIGRFFQGPTYGMSDTELQKYQIALNRQRRISCLQKEKEAEFKVAKYMATTHPDYFWNKYIYAFPKGAEERKRAAFLFALCNREVYGNYYGVWMRHKTALDGEFEEMGISLEEENFVKEYTKGWNRTEVRLTRRSERKMNLCEEDQRMYETLENAARMDISHLIAGNQRPQTIRRTRRPFKISN